MPSNKDRLYVALYARGDKPTMPGQEDKYHWAFIIGPKIETTLGKGVRYHAKEKLSVTGGSVWFFEGRECPLAPTSMLLIRITVEKVVDGARLVGILRNIPIRQNQPGWNCVFWLKEALDTIKADGRGLGISVIEWDKVRNQAMGYCQHKTDQHRFDGRGNFDMAKVPTYDLMQRKEVII
ncbi:hypothetical protein BDV19DRAFT_156035 [Aspergillus venezuelensis]